MLSPRAIHLFLKYFDSIDEALSRRLVRKRTWDEEALTSLLTELLDEEDQKDHNLIYPHNDFINDLSLSDEPLSISVNLETHSYPKPMERYVTQSDVGLILSYQDQFNDKTSFRRGWLLQAKRLFPTRQRSENGFTTKSKFESVDSEQHERMKRLRDWAECDFIQYMLYCPRPSSLEKYVREHLSSARSRALATHIFDYALGLELHDDLLSESSTVAAGIFITQLDVLPDSLLAVHQNLFRGVSPFSWFIVSQLAETNVIHHPVFAGSFPPDSNLPAFAGPFPSGGNLNNPIIEGLIRGDASVIYQDKTLVQVLENAEQAQIVPAHSISIKVINGIDRPRNKHIG